MSGYGSVFFVPLGLKTTMSQAKVAVINRIGCSLALVPLVPLLVLLLLASKFRDVQQLFAKCLFPPEDFKARPTEPQNHLKSMRRQQQHQPRLILLPLILPPRAEPLLTLELTIKHPSPQTLKPKP